MKLTAFLLPVSLLCSALPAAQAAITPLSPDTCRAMTALGIITPENPVPCERLVNVDVRFITFEGETRTGTITVADIIAPKRKRCLMSCTGKIPAAQCAADRDLRRR